MDSTGTPVSDKNIHQRCWPAATERLVKGYVHAHDGINVSRGSGLLLTVGDSGGGGKSGVALIIKVRKELRQQATCTPQCGVVDGMPLL